MSRTPNLGELSRNSRLGVLAEEVAFSIERALAGETLTQPEQVNLAFAAELLRSLPPGENRHHAPPGVKYMASNESYLEVIEVVRSAEPIEPIREFLDNVAIALEKAARAETADVAWLERASALFNSFGRAAQARTHDFASNTYRARRPWTSIKTTTNS